MPKGKMFRRTYWVWLQNKLIITANKLNFKKMWRYLLSWTSKKRWILLKCSRKSPRKNQQSQQRTMKTSLDFILLKEIVKVLIQGILLLKSSIKTCSRPEKMWNILCQRDIFFKLLSIPSLSSYIMHFRLNQDYFWLLIS